MALLGNVVASACVRWSERDTAERLGTMSNKIITFPPARQTSDGPSIAKRGKDGVSFEKQYCSHVQLQIDTDTQLVSCKACNHTMSAYNALMLLVKEWDHRHYDLTEWKKMKAEQHKEDRLERVGRIRRQLQWPSVQTNRNLRRVLYGTE